MENGELTFGLEAFYSDDDINHNVWVAVDNFRLTYLGDSTHGDDSGIRTLESDSMSDPHATYNLQGQRVGYWFKGIVVRNGKKYFQK